MLVPQKRVHHKRRTVKAVNDMANSGSPLSGWCKVTVRYIQPLLVASKLCQFASPMLIVLQHRNALENEPPPKQAVKKREFLRYVHFDLTRMLIISARKVVASHWCGLITLKFLMETQKKIWSWSDSGGHLSSINHLQKRNSLTFQWLYMKGDASPLICILFTTFYCQFRNRQRKAVVSFRPSSVFKI